MPRTVVSPATMSSSEDRPEPPSTTLPSMTLDDRSRSDASLAADRPAPRSASSGTAASASGVSGPSTSARTRWWMARAAEPASCWKVMARTSAPKCPSGSPGRYVIGPATATRLASTGSRAATSRMAAAREILLTRSPSAPSTRRAAVSRSGSEPGGSRRRRRRPGTRDGVPRRCGDDQAPARACRSCSGLPIPAKGSRATSSSRRLIRFSVARSVVCQMDVVLPAMGREDEPHRSRSCCFTLPARA